MPSPPTSAIVSAKHPATFPSPPAEVESRKLLRWLLLAEARRGRPSRTITQSTARFNAADVRNMVGVATRQELPTLLGQDVRKVLIATIHKLEVMVTTTYGRLSGTIPEVRTGKRPGTTHRTGHRLQDPPAQRKQRQDGCH
jgi:hypothetical protein